LLPVPTISVDPSTFVAREMGEDPMPGKLQAFAFKFNMSV